MQMTGRVAAKRSTRRAKAGRSRKDGPTPSFWPELDDNDPVPWPVRVWVRPPTLGELRRDAKQARRWRAYVCAGVKIRAKAEMRQTYERALVLPDLTQPKFLGMLSDAAVRVGMAVFDELEEHQQSLRGRGGKKHGEAVKAKTAKKHDRRWLKHLEGSGEQESDPARPRDCPTDRGKG